MLLIGRGASKRFSNRRVQVLFSAKSAVDDLSVLSHHDDETRGRYILRIYSDTFAIVKLCAGESVLLRVATHELR